LVRPEVNHLKTSARCDLRVLATVMTGSNRLWQLFKQ
jgi:hypothetical protein